MTADHCSSAWQFILPPALGANQRVDLIDLREQPRPCPLPCVHGDFLAVIQRLEARVFRIRGVMWMGCPPALRRTGSDVGHLGPASLGA